MKVLYIASANKKKLMEMHQLLGDLPIDLRDTTHLGFPFEVDEDQPTYEGNALKKSRTLFQLTGEWCIADDSGLEVDVLGGIPGVHSARYAGLPTDDLKNNLKLLDAIQSFEKPKAQFRSIISLSGPTGDFITEGIVSGHLIHVMRGTNGFGYNPIFVADGFERTFGEIDSDLKNAISHRSQALNKMKPLILDYHKRDLTNK
jgi:non-canonical purine NTP pyrophosphatase (RdgB/HAM1 family)